MHKHSLVRRNHALSLVFFILFFILQAALQSHYLPARSQEAAPTFPQKAKEAATRIRQPIRYTLTVPESEDASQRASDSPQLHVTVTAIQAPAADLEFAIPAWTPGYYQILHYETAIHNIRAQEADGTELHITHPSERVWRIVNSTRPPSSVLPITISYDVDANEAGLGFFGSSLDLRNKNGYVHGASTLMYPVGQTQSPCTLTLHAPTGWRVASAIQSSHNFEVTSANSIDTKDTNSVNFEAATYDDLIDSPIQMGKFETIDFQESGVEFQCVFVGRQPGNKASIRDSLRRIAQAAIGLFGSAPFTHYQFLYHLGGSGFLGGLEHHNSTVIHLTGTGNGTNEDFLTTSAHEFFHAWNVKRLRPEGLGPFDYTQSVRTASLWFAEGVTDYYAQLLLVRSGLKTREWFWRDMLHRIQVLDHTPSRIRVTLHDASTHAWEGESEGFDGLSYYLKGSLVGLYFDLRLNALTHNKAGLDDVMRRLDVSYGERNVAYPEVAILAALNAVAGENLQTEYTSLINSTEEIDWNRALSSAGLQLQRESAPFLGIRFAEDQGGGNGVLIQSVESGHSAAKMGILAGDRLIHIQTQSQGHRLEGQLTADNFHDILRMFPPHAALSVQVQRGDQLLRFTGVAGEVYENHNLIPLPIGTFSTQERQDAKDLQNKLFSAVSHPVQSAHSLSVKNLAP